MIDRETDNLNYFKTTGSTEFIPTLARAVQAYIAASSWHQCRPCSS